MSVPTSSSRSPLMSALPAITWTCKKRRWVNPGPVRSAQLPPITSTYKRRRPLNSGLGNIALVDEEGVVHCGSNDQSLEDLDVQNSKKNCDFSTTARHEIDCMDQIGKASIHGIKNNNDRSHGVNVDHAFTTSKATCKATCKAASSMLSRKHSRSQNYWPKINHKTKPKKLPKAKKVKPSKRNMHESGMPQACHVADDSVHVPQTPEPLDYKGINLRGSLGGEENVTPIQTRSCRRAITFSNTETRSYRAISFNDTKTDESVGRTDLVASFTDVNAGKYKWIFKSFSKDSEFQDFESCIGMKKIISEYKREFKRRSGIPIEDLKGALPHFSLSKMCATLVKIPRKKRSKRNRPRKMLPVDVASNAKYTPSQLENIALENVSTMDVSTMEQKYWTQKVISEDLLNPYLKSRCPAIPMDHVEKEKEVYYTSPYVGSLDTAQREVYSALTPYVGSLDSTHMPGLLDSTHMPGLLLHRSEADNALIPGGRVDSAQGHGRKADNVLIPHADSTHMPGLLLHRSEADNALIPYGGRVDSAQGHGRKADNALIPHAERLDPPKYSVKVDICPNTIRVWNLLMGNDGGLDDTDEKTTNWLEEQTKRLAKRIDVFIACMNLIQGNRPFTYWRGSVVDSVFGVFLTQNVTDVFSSSSFMALGAKYPPKHRRKIEKESTFSRNENAKDFPQPQSNPPDMESSCQKSLPQNVPYSSSDHADLNLLPDLNLPVNSNFSSSSLVHEESFVESNNREKDINRNGGCESSTIQVETEDGKVKPTNYWYLKAKAIATVDAKERNDKKKINQKKPKLDGRSGKKKDGRSGKKKDGRSGKKKGKKVEKQDKGVYWEELKQTYCTCTPRSYDSLDAVDWEAVRRAPLEEVAEVIEGRGMHNLIAGRMKDLLDRLVKDHGSIDLEWLREVPPIKAKDYLLDIDGIGLKSAECIRLLSLDQHAFPVDVNIGRIAVRLGWVPLQPFPDGVLIHLLEKYPVMDDIQKYLWPRLQGLDKSKLFELHYHLITFGKVFCKKRRPNCNACPMKGDCKHFASAYASEKLSLPAPNKEACASETPTPLLLEGSPSEPQHESVREPIIEVPSSPEPQCVETPLTDIEDLCSERDDYIPTIALNTKAFRKNVQMELERRKYMHHDISKALVSLTQESASIFMKKKRELRTEHVVYKLEDDHPLLARFEQRVPEDPNPYLVKVWSTDAEMEEQSDQMVLGTILIPCKTANQGRFPLSGTYFQTNEVFADEESSQNPISIPRNLLLNSNRRLLYCGTSASAIFTDCDLQKITYSFWKGFICVRGVNKITIAPKTLGQRFHKRPLKKQDLEE